MTEKFVHHSADEIVHDLSVGNVDLAGAKLRECYLSGELSQVAEGVRKASNNDNNWFNDIELVTAGDKVTQVYLKTVPFTGKFFGTKLFDANDGDNPDPAKDILSWNRVMNYKNLREKEKAQH